jgi:peroxiredoxin
MDGALEKTVNKKPSDRGLAPDFEATDIEGRKVRLSDYRGRSPVVLVFLRGFG